MKCKHCGITIQKCCVGNKEGFQVQLGNGYCNNSDSEHQGHWCDGQYHAFNEVAQAHEPEIDTVGVTKAQGE